jgi:hypothetical protein
MQAEIDRAHLWRAGSYSLLVCVVVGVIAMVLLSASGLHLVFWAEGATVIALLGLNLWLTMNGNRSRHRRGPTRRGSDPNGGHRDLVR